MLPTRSSRLATAVVRPSITGQKASQILRCYADQSSSKQSDSGTGNQSSGRTPPGPKQGAKPKILDEAPPANPPEEVKQHNREFEERHDRASGKINPDGKDNVGKGFWSGTGGVDGK